MRGLTYGDFKIGDRFSTARRRITEFDVMQFVTFTGFLEPLFLDPEYIDTRALHRGRRIVPGGLTFVLAEGLAVQTGMIHGTGLAFLGIDNMTLSAPVEIGNSIQVSIEVLARKDKPALGGGIVTFRHVVTVADRRVMRYDVLRLIAEREYSDASTL
jgi:acyl dehydratase